MESVQANITALDIAVIVGYLLVVLVALLPNAGPPEAGISRLFHDDGLVASSG
ncbi:hypothetical protein [Alloyangia pacifica]|uniref:hypothetical protein n=1 Tax=Alloyangia pacifica TaxID=311180 RepID=UPI001CD36E9C|nr:hypothetical protein [Alloyangia pacifica]MCA0998595.1 hypothetical protein [Alloyangia pacifica]